MKKILLLSSLLFVGAFCPNAYAGKITDVLTVYALNVGLGVACYFVTQTLFDGGNSLEVHQENLPRVLMQSLALHPLALWTKCNPRLVVCTAITLNSLWKIRQENVRIQEQTRIDGWRSNAEIDAQVARDTERVRAELALLVAQQLASQESTTARETVSE